MSSNAENALARILGDGKGSTVKDARKRAACATAAGTACNGKNQFIVATNLSCCRAHALVYSNSTVFQPYLPYGWKCDVCDYRGGAAEHRFCCNFCAFDICLSCHFRVTPYTEPVKASSLTLACPLVPGTPLSLYNIGAWNCDVCKKEYKRGQTVSYGCHIPGCDYDVCLSCAEQWL